MPNLNRPLVLCIELDQSFVDAPTEDREAFLHLCEENHEHLKLVYMSHDNAQNLISRAAQAEMPVPELFLADSGTTLLKGDGTGSVESLQRNIIQLWPGKEQVVKALGAVEGVTVTADDAPCRQGVEVSGEEATEALEAKVGEMGCDLERRGENAFDVLPYGVNKGTTLGRWIVEANVNPNNVLSFGDGMGDENLFGRGWRGAVYAHAPDGLKEEGGRYHNVTLLENSAFKGTMEALRRQGWMEMAAKA